ncbi:hypothetical protein IWQ56_005678, partial [Coemansia nantahalensis]
PICGPHASARSNFLTASTVVSAGAFLLHAAIQPRAVFQRPDAGAAPPPEPCDGDPTEQDGATPLARHADLPAAQLADTPEPAASWAGRVTFSWINFLMRRGARQQLDAGDLYALHRTELPVASWERFQRCRRPGRALVVTLALTFAPEFLLQAAYSVMASLLSFAGPFFLQRIIRAIEQADGSDANLRTAYLDAFGLLLFTLGQTLAESQKLWVGRIISIRLKGLLVAELSAKTLRRRGKGTWEDDKDAGRDGEGDADGGSGEPAAEAAVDGKIMNLLTADFQRVGDVASYLDNLYSMPMVLVVAIWYMYQLMGVAALLGLLISVVYAPLSKAMFQYAERLEDRLNSISDERVAAITELIQGIKAVKLFGWESRFVAKISERRERQLACLWRLLQSWASISAVSALAPLLVLATIFGLHVIVFGNRLTAEVAFTALSVFEMIRVVFAHLPGFLTWAIGGYVSLNRIGSFLDQPEVQNLEARVQPESAAAALGFSGADLEWETAPA